MHMVEQGCIIINGQKVEGRTLSFDTDGLKVNNGEHEEIVVPNEQNFTWSYSKNKDDVEEIMTPQGKITICRKIYKQKSNKKLFIALGAALCACIAVGGIILYKKRC